MKKKIRFLLVLFAASFLIFTVIPKPTFADTCSGSITCPQTILDLAPYAVLIIATLLAVAVVVFFFMIILNGYTFITAGGDTKKVAKAQKSLFFSALGFAIIFLVFFIFGLIINTLGVSTGVTIDKNGNIHIDYSSHFTATALPKKLVSTYVPQAGDQGPTGTGGGGSINGDPNAGGVTSTNGYGPKTVGKLEDGCNVEFVGDMPIDFQWEDTNPGPDTPGAYGGSAVGGPGINCEMYGEYNGSESITDSWRKFDCSAGVLSGIINLYAHKAGAKDGFVTIYDIAQIETNLGVMDSSDGYTGGNYVSKTASAQMGRFSAMLDIVNQKGRGIRFIGAAASIKDATNLQAIYDDANSGNPVIVGGLTVHFFTVLSANTTTVTVADAGPLTGLGSFGSSGRFLPGGVQTISKTDFERSWDGTAILLEPQGAHGHL